MTSRTWYARRRLLGIDSIAMTHPVFGGDTLYATSSITALNPTTDLEGGQVSISIEGSNQRGEVVSRIACRMEVYRRGRHPEDSAEELPAEEERFQLYHKAKDGALIEQTGLDFEDLVSGETFVHWPGRTFGFAESRLHALRSLEINPRWSDEAYLRRHSSIEPAISSRLLLER
jgi:itaconyl-CoA hydratase